MRVQTWPHAPSKCVTAPGIIFVTAGTYCKRHLFRGDERLAILHNVLLDCAQEEEWTLMAWAVFSNHYHFIGASPDTANPASVLCSKIHTLSATALNQVDGTPSRRVWYRSFDTRLTFEKSVMARLAYVHNNPVKHGLVKRPEDYQWSSARWFLHEGDRPFVESVLSFKTDRVNVYDDF